MNIVKDGRLILSGCLVFNDKNEILLLYKKNHKHYETPGGKVNLDECSNPDDPTIEDLKKAASRELFEELGNNIEVEDLEYFTKVEFTIPDGRKAIAHKFITKIISGEPKVNEPEIFSKFDYLSINKLDQYSISPDLKLLINLLKKI
ncbi:NUDIX hydrolase [Candidatus Woesearchaeota archaeon]|nr:NUDIX hydrolase [Candidatus Woesearchaeota archaeon]